jgi:hypothetical protein
LSLLFFEIKTFIFLKEIIDKGDNMVTKKKTTAKVAAGPTKLFRCDMCGKISKKQETCCGLKMKDLSSVGCQSCRGCF